MAIFGEIKMRVVINEVRFSRNNGGLYSFPVNQAFHDRGMLASALILFFNEQ